MSFVSNLTKGWQATDLGSLVELKYGKSLPAQARDGIGFPVYGSNGVIGNHSEPIVARGGIVIGRKGSYGEVHLSDGSFSPIDTTYFIDEFFDQPARYWFYQLKHLPLSKLNRSTAIPGLNREDAYSLEILLPPLAEQQQIAAKLDELLEQVDIIKTRLDTIPKILKRFRQSVLAAATSGELTEDWRAKRASPLQAHGESEKVIGNSAPIGCVVDSALFTGWRDVRLSDISDVQGGVTKDAKKQLPEDEELPYLRVANVQRGYLDLSEIKTIRVPAGRLAALLLEPGDVLFTEGGDIDKLGRGWVWEGQIERCTFQNHVFRVRLYDRSNQPKYISWWGNFRGLNYFLQNGKQTTNLASINKSILSNLPVLLPPPEEQAEIVTQVEHLFAFADQVEQRVKDAHKRVNHLAQAILAKAFSGELTADWRAQNPDLISGENSAEALLAKIKAEREALAKNQPTKPRSIKKTGESMKPKNIMPIIEALKAAGQPLSSQDLLAQAGYPGDADTDQLETFFLDIREQLNAKTITRERKGDKEFFAIAE